MGKKKEQRIVDKTLKAYEKEMQEMLESFEFDLNESFGEGLLGDEDEVDLPFQ